MKIQVGVWDMTCTWVLKEVKIRTMTGTMYTKARMAIRTPLLAAQKRPRGAAADGSTYAPTRPALGTAAGVAAVIMVRSLSFAPHRFDSAGRAIVKKATLRTRMKARRKMALTAASPRRWLMKAVL